MDSILKSDGSGAPYLHMKAGGSAKPATIETVTKGEHFAYQEGSTVFKFAVTNMADVAAEIMERNNLSADDIRYLVPHQANKRIIDATANRMGVGTEKVMNNIARYGNTTAGTLPLCLWDYESQLKRGDNLILAAFGGGFTWGATWVKWAYDPK
jgi:3-oxoacyl-[acyl-carrier-protein] synthase-3